MSQPSRLAYLDTQYSASSHLACALSSGLNSAVPSLRIAVLPDGEACRDKFLASVDPFCRLTRPADFFIVVYGEHEQ
jgi:hypothetical protein